MQYNTITNAFTESKKLKYGINKCKKIHIGKETNICPDLKVHHEPMQSSEKETYLGDIIANNGKLNLTIQSRREKGFGMVSEILSILSEIPLGKHKIQIALILRQAMLLNGMLYSSEAWSDVKKRDEKQLEEVDEYLLRSIFKAHRKTPLEFLHLETGTVPIRFVMASRRMNYLHNILNENENELILKVYLAQKLRNSKR